MRGLVHQKGTSWLLAQREMRHISGKIARATMELSRYVLVQVHCYCQLHI